MKDIIGYFASGLIGISLGLIGGGGSVITIPVLVYLFNVEPSLATAYSLFIVGTTSLVGGIRNSMLKLVDVKSVILFSIPSLVTIYFTRRYLLPIVPENIFTIGSYSVTKDLVIMMLFSFIMILASVRMIKDKQQDVTETSPTAFHFLVIIIQGIAVGLVSGIVGAGGGFLIIPALVLLAHLPMKKAIGTSLVIISINSFFGFLGDMNSGLDINYRFILLLSGLAIVGVFIGTYLAKFIQGKQLKKVFGWFVLIMGFYIVIREFSLIS